MKTFLEDKIKQGIIFLSFTMFFYLVLFESRLALFLFSAEAFIFKGFRCFLLSPLRRRQKQHSA